MDVPSEAADEFGHSLANMIADRLQERKDSGNRPFTLRMSNIGKGGRQLWYDKRYGNEEKLEGHTLLKFIFGDIIEHLVLFLVGLSGHRVSALQAKVTLDGIEGHIDADINGITTDVKSASTHAFRKFSLPKDDPGGLVQNDSFGYIEQIAGYAKARDTDGAFLAVDKQNGHIAHLHFTKEELAVFNVEERIKHIKAVVESDEVPERCYPDQEEGQSGNRALGVNCSYCSHKERCWADANGGLGLRTFLYASGPKFLTVVKKEPQVREATF